MKLEKEKDKYSKTVAEKTKELSKLQQQLALLELDDSREAQAEKTKLLEKMADLQEDLSEKQADKAYDAVSDALDDMYKAYKKEKQKEIDILENSISSEEKIYSQAIKRINENWDTLYQDLIAWNTEYGTVVNSEISAAWDSACIAVDRYGSYLEAVLQTQRELAALEASSSSSSSSSVIGGSGSSSTPNVIGNSGEYDTSGAKVIQEANDIVAQMKQNSANWASGNKDSLHSSNDALAKRLEKLLGYSVTYNSGSGVWYMNGKPLYDQFPIYHSGGIVGDNSTLKQDEMFAKLKKGEAVLTKTQQEVVDKALDLSSFVPVPPEETMLGKYGKVLNSISGSDLMSVRMQEQIKQDAQQAQNVVSNGGDTYIDVPVQMYPAQKLDEKEIKDLTKKISTHTISELDDTFGLRGKRSFRR